MPSGPRVHSVIPMPDVRPALRTAAFARGWRATLFIGFLCLAAAPCEAAQSRARSEPSAELRAQDGVVPVKRPQSKVQVVPIEKLKVEPKDLTPRRDLEPLILQRRVVDPGAPGGRPRVKGRPGRPAPGSLGTATISGTVFYNDRRQNGLFEARRDPNGNIGQCVASA